MAVSIGNIWDQTTDVLAGRAGLLAPVAALAYVLPAAVQAAVTSYGGASPGVALLAAVVALAGVIAALWGSLTVIGVASDPDVTRQAASEAARRRLGASLLVSLVIGVAFVLAVVPLAIVLVASGFDLAAAARGTNTGGNAAAFSPAVGLFFLFYGLLLLVAGFWIGARLAVLSPVVLHERRGIGAIGRSVTLTRGLTLKLIGALLLLGIVWFVASLAAQYVVFVPLRLMLGTDNLATATWFGAVASAIVGAVFSTIVAVFTARLYAALAPARPVSAGA